MELWAASGSLLGPVASSTGLSLDFRSDSLRKHLNNESFFLKYTSSTLKSSHLIHCKYLCLFTHAGVYQSSRNHSQGLEPITFGIKAVSEGFSGDCVPDLSFIQALGVRWSFKVILPICHSATCVLIGRRSALPVDHAAKPRRRARSGQQLTAGVDAPARL